MRNRVENKLFMISLEQESNIFDIMKKQKFFFPHFWVLFTVGRCELAGVSQQVQAARHSLRWYPLYNDVFAVQGRACFD